MKTIYRSLFVVVGLAALAMLPELAHAKDVVQALSQTQTKARDIFMQLAPIGIIGAGVAFMFSKQMGTSLMVGSGLGLAFFAGRHSIVNMFMSIFG